MNAKRNALLAGVTLLTASSSAVNAETLHWYRGNTHTHTSAPPRSDANESPAFVAQWYRDHGYQFLVITDHEFRTDVKPLNETLGKSGDFLVLTGQEITQMVADPGHPGGVRHAHVNGIETNRVIMPIAPKETRTSQPMAEVYERNLREIRAAGGLPQINHPNRLWSVSPADLAALDGPMLLEIWNPASSSNNLGGTDANGHFTPSVEGLWDTLLSGGKLVWGAAADDAHTYHQFDLAESPNPGRAWVMVRAAELSKPAILDALRRGQFYASTGVNIEDYEVDDRSIEIHLRPLGQWSPALIASTRYITRFIGADGRVLAEQNGLTPRYEFKGDETYVRASVIDSDGRRAWTQPVFRDARKTDFTIERFKRSPFIMAHRACWSAEIPENSLLGINTCTEHGADMIEVDIHRTKDDVLVLIHDDTLDRTTDHTGRVDQMTYEQLKAVRLRAGAGGAGSKVTREGIPTLAEGLRAIRGKAVMFLDMKITNDKDRKDVLDTVVRENAQEYVAMYAAFARDRAAHMKLPEWARRHSIVSVIEQGALKDRSEHWLPTLEEAVRLYGDLQPLAFMVFLENPRFLSTAPAGSHIPLMAAPFFGLAGPRDEGMDMPTKADPQFIWGDLMDAGATAFMTNHPLELMEYAKQRRLQR